MRLRHIIGTIVVIIVALACVRLGFWQLDRLQQKRAYNQTVEARTSLPPVPVESLRDDPDAAYRRVEATGVFTPEEEIILYGRARTNGQPGNHILTPLVLADGAVLVVDRGWVPSSMANPPLPQASPPDGTTTVIGTIVPSATAGSEPLEPDATLVRSVDIEQLDQVMSGELLPFSLRAAPPAGDLETGSLPIAEEMEALDEGPHLGYAAQWFIFAVIAIAGWAVLVRKDLRTTKAHAVDGQVTRKAPQG